MTADHIVKVRTKKQVRAPTPTSGHEPTGKHQVAYRGARPVAEIDRGFRARQVRRPHAGHSAAFVLDCGAFLILDVGHGRSLLAEARGKARGPLPIIGRSGPAVPPRSVV